MSQRAYSAVMMPLISRLVVTFIVLSAVPSFASPGVYLYDCLMGLDADGRSVELYGELHRLESHLRDLHTLRAFRLGQARRYEIPTDDESLDIIIGSVSRSIARTEAEIAGVQEQIRKARERREKREAELETRLRRF